MSRADRAFTSLLVRSIAVAIVVALAAPAQAASARVALVHDENSSVLQQRTLTRLRAELTAAGFEVTDVVRTAGDAREAVEAEPPVAGVFATIAIMPRTPDAADVWIADRITGKTVVRRVRAGTDARSDAAAILAVRAVELLQASLLEAFPPADREEPRSSPALPADVSAWMERQHPRGEPAFQLQAGAGVLHSFGGIGPGILPLLGLSYRYNRVLSFGLRAGGPAFGSDLAAPGGTISVRQELVLLDLVYHLPVAIDRLRPFAVLGAGAYHVGVVGAARPPYQGRTGGLFAAAVDLGLGAEVRLGPRISLLADLRILFVTPRPVVRASGADVGSVSQPSLLGELAAQVGF